MVLNRHPGNNSSNYYYNPSLPPPAPPSIPSSSLISTIPSGGSNSSQFSIASAWEISARNRNGGFLFRNNRLLKSSNEDHRRFSRSCDELDNLENSNNNCNYSNSSEYSSSSSKYIPSTPFGGRRKPRIIARSPLVASPMLFRQSPRNLRSKSNAAHGLRNNNNGGGGGGNGLHRSLQYSVTLTPTVNSIHIAHQQQQSKQKENRNYG